MVNLGANRIQLSKRPAGDQGKNFSIVFSRAGMGNHTSPVLIVKQVELERLFVCVLMSRGI
jgi:hypothetical protein